MESHSSPHNKTKECYKTEPRSKNQHQMATVPPDIRRGNGFQLKKEGKSIDSSMQTKAPIGTVTPSTQTTLAPASAKASPDTSRAPLVPAAVASSGTSTTLLTTKIPDMHAVGITQGTTVTTGSSEHKIKYSREGELKTKYQISTSTDSQKSLQKTTRTALPESVQQTTFSQIPKTMSNPKQRSSPTPTIAVDQADTFFKGSSKEMAPSPAHQFKSNDNKACVIEDSQEARSVQPLGTKQSKVDTLHRNKDEEKDREWKEEEGIHKDIQVGCTLKGTDITLQVASKCPLFRLDRGQLPPGETTTSALHVKKTGSDTDENAMAQERQCEREKRKEHKEGLEGNGISTREIKSIQDQIKSFNNTAMMTEENSVPVQTLETAMQTELLYVDVGIQAVVEVGNKSTSMSPSWSQMDHKVNLSNHDTVSGTVRMSLRNGCTQDDALDSGLPPITLASVEPAAKDLRPTPYKSSMSSKTTKQHVCQIQIELCSQSTLSDSQALPAKKDSQASSTRSGLEREPKQVDREGDQAETGRLPEVAWDEQGMTWEVYGAAVDMESLGFAIQNHLQHKIQEHEQRIRHLRKSVSLSEQSNSDEKGASKKKKKKKRNVFRSLFQRPTCCLTTDSEA